MLTVEKKQSGNVSIVDMAGRITLGRDCQQVEWAVDDLLKENAKKIVLNLTEVNFIDSTGIGIIVMCAGKAKVSKCVLAVAGASGLVDQTLRLTNVDKIVPMHADLEAAVASSAGQAAG